MPMVPADLADGLRSALGFPLPVSSQLTSFATGVVDELQNHGIASIGSPVGTISGLSGSSLATSIANASYGGVVSSQLQAFGNSVAQHITTAGIVTYVDSPVFAFGGTVSGLDGSALATLIASGAGYPSVSSKLLAEANEIVSYIEANCVANGGTLS